MGPKRNLRSDLNQDEKEVIAEITEQLNDLTDRDLLEIRILVELKKENKRK